MKRLMTLMLACAAVLVMGIAAAGVQAQGGDDSARDQAERGATPTQPCDQRGENEAGDDHGTDSRVRMSEDSSGTSGDDSHEGTSGDDHFDGRDGDDDDRGGDGD